MEHKRNNDVYLAIFTEQVFQISTVGSQRQASNEEIIARVQVNVFSSVAKYKLLIQYHLQQMYTYGGSLERERLRYRLSWRMGERERERLRGLRPRSSG